MSLPSPSDAQLEMTPSPSRVAFYTSNLSSFISSPSTFRILRTLSPPTPLPPIPPTPKNLTSATFDAYDAYRGPLYFPPTATSTASNEPLGHPKNPSRDHQSPSNPNTPQTLYILDSSFNPPTLAHAHICLSALNDHYSSSESAHTNARLLILLSTQNADKKITGASLEERLVGMECFANDLLTNWYYPHSAYHYKKEKLDRLNGKSSEVNESESSDAESLEIDSNSEPEPIGGTKSKSSLPQPPSSEPLPPDNPNSRPKINVDIGLTSLPYFHDKSAAIEASSLYPPSTTHIHCTGYDTLIRVLNPKYYPPTHDLSPLIPFLSNHKLRVTYRIDKDCTKEDQDAYLSKMQHELPSLGGKKEWIEDKKIYMASGLEGKEISSTKVRSMVKQYSAPDPHRRGQGSSKFRGKGKQENKKIKEGLKGVVGTSVGKWITGEKLYRWEAKENGQ
ncbi:Bcpof1 [Botrytis cinerea B05.10]|uniref:Bcpof1 n=3 Tax=Botryotinia fuckeliana TaxID=40559 RepID=A0A384JFY3_BOTFB|nr:Bcpof1 [Botrytis cinerea B05.10]ATZ49535.1 Bcpof1 [Botrytis cinerea B05.10]EMR89748.1 putative cytidylyltransferase family protein [Botrytis cinerea BcDW1]CCD45207.1 hypothetical protein BofuT4_P009240.1 [Botrytis cinerea T4]